MVDSQKQEVSKGSTAVQASGSVTINQGLTTAQMSEIMSAIAVHVERLSSVARGTIEERLNQLQSSLIDRFSSDQSARSDAFAEPDFQAAVLDAQKSYARSGDEGLKLALTDLIAQRSRKMVRSRLSLTLNDAIAKIGFIPDHDLNLLSLIFLFKHVQFEMIGNMQTFCQCFEGPISSIIDSISTSESAASYLAAHGCIVPPSIGVGPSLYEILRQRYPAIATKGIPEERLRELYPDYDLLVLRQIVINSPFNDSLKRFSIVGPILEEKLPGFGFFGDYSTRYLDISKDFQMNEDEFRGEVERISLVLHKLFDVYDSHSIVRSSALTSVGIALAHANLKSSAVGNADLSIWIHD